MTAPASIGAEKFRALAVRLLYLQDRQDLKKVVITSTIKGEGKSVVAANLALTCSHRQRTLLIDGDLRQSGLAELFGSRDVPGLTDWWQGTQDITDFLRLVQPTPLWYLPVGTRMTEPLEVLQSQRLANMLAQLSESFSWIIIDCPPLVPVADPNIWAAHAEGTLLVVRQGKTPKRLLLKTLQETADLKLLGVVMNESQDVSHQYYAQYYRATPNGHTARSLREPQLPEPEARDLVIE
jgi:capsular exopolysaccharide synthesis family protein